MGLTMNERKAVTAVMVARYRRASKKQKGRLLDELIALTGYNRWYAVGLLRGHATTPEERRGRINKRPRQRPRVYDAAVLAALRRGWGAQGCMLGDGPALAVCERRSQVCSDR